MRELEQLIAWRGKPNRIRVDNGPEYISHAMREWAEERGIELKFIQPGSPYQNGYVERFNKSYREGLVIRFTAFRIRYTELSEIKCPLLSVASYGYSLECEAEDV